MSLSEMVIDSYSVLHAEKPTIGGYPHLTPPKMSKSQRQAMMSLELVPLTTLLLVIQSLAHSVTLQQDQFSFPFYPLNSQLGTYSGKVKPESLWFITSGCCHSPIFLPWPAVRLLSIFHNEIIYNQRYIYKLQIAIKIIKIVTNAEVRILTQKEGRTTTIF